MNRFLSFIQYRLINQTSGIVIGYFSLCVLIWVGGKYFLLDVNTRVLLIVVLSISILMYYVVKWLITYFRGKSLSRAINKQSIASSRKDSEIESLKSKMDAAVETLKTSELGLKYRGSAALYALPWYMLIGPSAAGKSTLLRNSGLHFPYAHTDDIDIKGFGGTHNCDWWFSDEAIILDTAGRYTTEDSDNPEWLEFLALLNKYRKKMPLNGIVVAISLADILTSDNDSIDNHIQVIRERINELTSKLGFVFPLYIVFTKCDLLNGFTSFFSNLTEDERKQVWGATVEYRPDEQPSDIVEKKLKELYVRLCDIRIKNLSLYRKQKIKSEIYDFPSQFLAASERILEFIRLLFKDNPYQETPNFKGVYFSSGTQEGLPLQRIIGNLQLAFGQVRDSSLLTTNKQTKSYFIKSLFSDVIFKSSVDVLLNYRNKIIYKWIKATTILVSFVLVTVNLLYFSASYTSNKLLVSKGVKLVAELKNSRVANASSHSESYMRLVDVYQHREKLVSIFNEESWLNLGGMYQAYNQIQPLNETVIAVMEREFLIPVTQRIEEKLRMYSQQWSIIDENKKSSIYKDYYEALRLYLVLSSAKKLEEFDILPELALYWDDVLKDRSSISETKLNSYKLSMPKLLRLYLDEMIRVDGRSRVASHWVSNKYLIKVSRNNLIVPMNPQALYVLFKEKSKSQFKNVSVNDVLSSRGSNYIYSTKKISTLFTRKAWEQYVLRELENIGVIATSGDWVLGTESAKSRNVSVEYDRVLTAKDVVKQLRTRYFLEFEREWYRFLSSLKLKGSFSISDSANKLSLLSRTDGPFSELFSFINYNISISEPNSLRSNPVVDIISNNKLPNKKIKNASVTDVSVVELNQTFKDLRRFTAIKGKEEKSLDNISKYLKTLTALYNNLEHLRASPERSRESDVIASNILSGLGQNTPIYIAWATTKNIISGSDAKNRSFLAPLLTAPIIESWGVILESAVHEIENKWSSIVLTEYDERIRGRFPFTKQGPDATLDDVSEFFRPKDGVIWTFVDEHVSAYLNKRKGAWVERKWLGYGPRFSRQFLSSLSTSRKISNSLFKRGKDEPSIVFHLYPVPTTGLSEILLETNGQRYRYRNEPQEWRKFIWPGTSANSGARIVGISKKDNIQVEYESPGLWGLFHLFSKANIVKQRGIQYLTIWDLKSYNGKEIKIKFKIRADRRNNILKTNLFKRFYLPRRVTVKPKNMVAIGNV